MSTLSALQLFPSPPKHDQFNLNQPLLTKVSRDPIELKALSQHLATVKPEVKNPAVDAKAEQTERIFIDLSGLHSTDSTRPSLDVEETVPGRRSLDTISTRRPSRQYSHRRKRSNSLDLNPVAEHCVQQTFEIRPRTAIHRNMRSRTPVSTGSSVYSRRTSASTTKSDSIDTPVTSYTISPIDFKCTGISTEVILTNNDASAETKQANARAKPLKLRTKAVTSKSSIDSIVSNAAFPPRTLSLRSNKTVASIQDDEPTKPTQSMFPQYDANKPLSQQSYFPIGVALPAKQPVIAAQSSQTSAGDDLHSRRPALRKDSGVAVAVTEDERIPEMTFEDLNHLWMASTRLGACSGRKVRLGLHFDVSTSRYSLLHGDTAVFTAKLDETSKGNSSLLSLDKINPVNAESTMLANVTISPNNASTKIFPQQAAFDALSAASSGSKAMSIARLERSAKPKAAEQLVQQAVREARETYCSELSRINRAQDSIGTISVRYMLKHSVDSEFIITVGRSVAPNRIYTTTKPQIKIAIHEASDDAAHDMQEDSALLCLDFGRDVCMIDIPAILDLEAEYMLDTAIAALLTVAVIESGETIQAPMTFAAPPEAPVKLSKKERKVLRKAERHKPSHGIWNLRKTQVREIDEGLEAMSGPAKSALAIIELGLNGAFWALEKGFKSLDERAGRSEK